MCDSPSANIHYKVQVIELFQQLLTISLCLIH